MTATTPVIKYRRAATLATIIGLSAFCVFVFAFEQVSLGRANARIREHAKVIANALWNFDHNSATEYLNLAAEAQNYERLRVFDPKGEIFQQIESWKPSPFEQALVRIRLIPRVTLVSPIEKNGGIIGRIEAVWLPRTLFVHAYVFFALLLCLIITHLYMRLLLEKRLLEERVQDRTAELSFSNESLREEVAERKRAEEKLRASESKLRLMTETITDVLWTMDMNLNYTYISPSVEQHQGWSLEEAKTLTIEKSLTPAALETAVQKFTETLDEAKKTGNYNKTVTLELELNRKDGTTIWTEIITTFLLDADKKPIGIIGITRDISERLKTQQEREELRKQLDRSKKMEALGLLAGGVAHDLNNVLSGIVSYPDLLLMDLPKDSPLRSPIQTIKESGQKAATIVQDLLALARRSVMSMETLNVNHLIKEYLASPEHAQLMSYHPGLRVETRFETHLPDVKGASVHLKKTIMNLIANAAEARPRDGLVQVTTQSRFLDRPLKAYYTVERGEYVVIIVEDRGEGIAAADLNRIFEPFYTKKKMGRSGTGLGMAVVWGTVQDHNGYIDIQSAKGQGTTISLYLPMTREPMAQERKSFQIEEIKGNRESILVVDDMPEQREIAAKLLSALNYKVSVVSSGEEAVAFLNETPADLVVLDMIMEPGIDGLETFKRIREIRPGQKVIIASGFAETDRVKEAQSIGAGAYIRKPYVLEKIGAVIKDALQS